MPKTLLALPLLLSVVPVASALPPEAPSGAMVLQRDEVADGLWEYRKEKDEEKRVEWLAKLAPTPDPRVAVALGEALSDPSLEVRVRAAKGIIYHHTGWYIESSPGSKLALEWARKWWEENEADLRRRARDANLRPQYVRLRRIDEERIPLEHVPRGAK